MPYWELQNSDGKHWIIPTKNVSTALGIYQPSYWKGKLLKRILPLFGGIKSIFSPFPLVELPLDSILVKRLEGVFPNHRLEYSLFLGTPSVHQKTVIQIFEGHKILGYAKVSEKECVKQLFDHEETILQELSEKGIRNIPRCLYNQKIDDSRALFVMTTEKNGDSVTEHSWTEWHEAFQEELRQKTHKSVLFEDSDFAHLLKELSLRIDDMPYETAKVVAAAIKSTMTKYQGKLCDMSVMHGDFTPWNIFRQNDHLYVYDWEYAQRTCPIGLDKCHFLIQSFIYEKHWNTKQILGYLINDKRNSTNIETLRMYLLAVLSIYVCRESEGTMNANIDTYLKLLAQLHESYK